MYAISVIVSANCISAFSGNRRVLRSSNSRWPEQAGMQRVPNDMVGCPLFASSDGSLTVRYEFQHGVDQAGIRVSRNR